LVERDLFAKAGVVEKEISRDYVFGKERINTQEPDPKE
jgi:hypothetical protein